ncbi:MAG: gliding motility-associated C-terminal domain-containing protein [Paludibacter sp.]|nr:gliding motility-associated C-terminal domain-containing protein [Paludibacter sp.]
MKKYNILIILLLGVVFSGKSQISVENSGGGVVPYTDYTGIDYLVVFDQITTNSKIEYTGEGTTFEWYKFSNPTTSISNQQEIWPDGDTGYLLVIDGTQTITIWVMDYSMTTAKIDDITFNSNDENACEYVILNFLGNIPPLSYQTSSGVIHFIDRDLDISYTTQNLSSTATFSCETNPWITNDTIAKTILNSNSAQVPAPLVNTVFNVSMHDRFGDDLFIAPVVVQSITYQAVAVKNKLITETVTRDAENEDQRPDNVNFLEGSAPLDIHFCAHPTDGVKYNQWTVYKDNQFYLTRSSEDFRWTFNDFGHYKIVLVSSNQQCSYTDSVIVQINESALQVPNVFTPNGDGINDEFRVAYRSLRLDNFQMAVYNRWGNKIYTSTDPEKGWNGKIGQRDAVAGPYFYYIKAEGTDGKKYTKKGDINLIR